jgi:hypothetical protein
MIGLGLCQGRFRFLPAQSWLRFVSERTKTICIANPDLGVVKAPMEARHRTLFARPACASEYTDCVYARAIGVDPDCRAAFRRSSSRSGTEQCW